MKTQNTKITIIILAMLMALSISVVVLKQKKSTFPPVGVQCFDDFKSIIQTGYADTSLNLPLFELKKVFNFRCASQKGFSQYEISGVDNQGHNFYVHYGAGGVAASGADTYFDYCYKKDGNVIRSDKILGHNPRESGTCYFAEDFPRTPTSIYTYTSVK